MILATFLTSQYFIPEALNQHTNLKAHSVHRCSQLLPHRHTILRNNAWSKNCKVNELLLIVKGRERESNGWFIQYCVLNVMCDRWYLAGTCEFGKTDQELKSYGKLKPTSVLQLMVLTWITSTLGTLCLVFVLSMLLASHKCCICLWQE